MWGLWITRPARPCGRRLAYCAECGALERHRALISEFAATIADGRGRRALEIGPVSATCFKGYLEQRGWDAVSIDRWRTGNPHDPRGVSVRRPRGDLTDLSIFADGGSTSSSPST